MNTKLKVILFSLLCISLMSISAISAQDINDNITINEENNDYDNLENISTATNFTTLQEDINSNDVIELKNTVKRQPGESDLIINKTTTIDGKGNTINANNLGRIFNVTNSSLTLKNIILINGKFNSDFGGAIYAEKSNLTITSSNFTGNNATIYGGAIYAAYSNLTIKGSNFTGNNATIFAGAIYVGYSNSTITDSSFSDNNADIVYGGAVYIGYSNSTITDSTFTNNNANTGGAVYIGYSNSTITDSTFTNNNANTGGAVYIGYSNSIINDSNFTNNNNGAIKALYSVCNLSNSIFINNNINGVSTAYQKMVLSVFVNNKTTDTVKLNENFNLTATLTDNQNNSYYSNGLTYKISNGVNITASELFNAITNLTNSGSYIITANYTGIYNINNPNVNNASLTVNSKENSFTTLNNLIQNNTNGTLTLESNYKLFSDEITTFKNGIVINKTIAIDGNDYTIDANNTGRIFNITSTGSLTLKNTVLINSNTSYNSGAICNYGDCTVTNCNFINNNESFDGGAICNYGDCIVTNSSFINNTANKYGGAICNYGDCTVTNSSFINNTASNYGGAIRNYKGNCTVTNSSFINNTVSNYGGAISNSKGDFTVINGIFINNAASFGGAIDNFGNCTMTNSSFINNTATKYGGAIHNDNGNYTVTNCNYINNTAGYYGGAIYNNGVNCTMCDSTFDNILSNNSEIYLYNGYSFLRNNTFNIKENTPCIELYNGYITSPTITIVMNNKTETATLFNNYKIKVVFTDDNGNIIRIHNNTKVIINEFIYDLIDNGTYSYYNYTPNEVATYNIGASATSLTNLTVKNGTLVVSSIKLSLENLTKYYGASDKLIATLTDSDKPLIGEHIEFIINGNHYNHTTDSNGQAFLAINLAPGVYPVSASYNNTFLVNGTVTILSTVQSSDLVKFYKNSTGYSAKFLDTEGNLLVNREVKFNIHGVFYTKTTDNNGVASLNINLASGVYIITAINPVTGEEKGNNITVLSSIVSKDVTLYYRNGTKYEVIFYKSEGVPLTNTVINLNINGVLYERTTDNNGIATLNINLDPADYIITAINPLNGEMIGSTVKILPVLEGNDMEFTYGDDRHYTVKSLDGQGNPLANQIIKMNINGVFYTKTTDSNGEAKLNIRLNPGEYIITSYWNTAITSNTIKIRS